MFVEGRSWQLTWWRWEGLQLEGSGSLRWMESADVRATESPNCPHSQRESLQPHWRRCPHRPPTAGPTVPRGRICGCRPDTIWASAPARVGWLLRGTGGTVLPASHLQAAHPPLTEHSQLNLKQSQGPEMGKENWPWRVSLKGASFNLTSLCSPCSKEHSSHFFLQSVGLPQGQQFFFKLQVLLLFLIWGIVALTMQ